MTILAANATLYRAASVQGASAYTGHAVMVERVFAAHGSLQPGRCLLLGSEAFHPDGRDNFGSGNRFIAAPIANGKAYVGTPNGGAVFGLITS